MLSIEAARCNHHSPAHACSTRTQSQRPKTPPHSRVCGCCAQHARGKGQDIQAQRHPTRPVFQVLGPCRWARSGLPIGLLLLSGPRPLGVSPSQPARPVACLGSAIFTPVQEPTMTPTCPHVSRQHGVAGLGCGLGPGALPWCRLLADARQVAVSLLL